MNSLSNSLMGKICNWISICLGIPIMITRLIIFPIFSIYNLYPKQLIGKQLTPLKRIINIMGTLSISYIFYYSDAITLRNAWYNILFFRISIILYIFLWSNANSERYIDLIRRCEILNIACKIYRVGDENSIIFGCFLIFVYIN